MQPQLLAGRYQVIRAIGRGGMGTVWLCHDDVLGREVAVKQIGSLPGDSATETKRAMREARSAAAFNHPNAVAVYDVINHEERPWLVMEYIEGQTLADEISRAGQLSPRRVADVGAQLAGALARAHERRIVHRDIKPGNVLIDKAGHPKISDFGIARGHGDDQLTAIGFITGTPGYLSPELARGADPHPASDVWALGATLYAAVEGQSPYQPRSNPIALLRAIATERPRPMKQAGPLGPAIEAMMHEDPAQRWDMATSARALVQIASVDATAVLPQIHNVPTAVIALPPAEPTRRLDVVVPPTEPTRPLDVVVPLVEATRRLDVVVAPVEPTRPLDVAAPLVEATRRLDVVVPPVEPTRLLATAAPAVTAAAVGHPAPAAVRGLQPDVAAPPADARTRIRRRLALVLVAFLVAALGGTYLLDLLAGTGSTTAVQGATATSPTARAKTTVPGSSESPRKTIREQSSPAAADPAPVSDKKLEHFMRSYYEDVTKDTDHTWEQLSSKMQDAAQGRDSYDSFWTTIDKVKVNQIRVNGPPTTAVVNLTFIGKDGRRSTENHRFTFVTDGEDYLIDSEQILR